MLRFAMAVLVALGTIGVGTAGYAQEPANASDAKALAGQGFVALVEGKKDQAERLFRKAIAVDAKYAMGHYGLGLTLYRMAKPAKGNARKHLLQQARNAAQKAIQLNPKDALFQKLMGDIAAKQDKPKEAIDHYSTAIKLAKKDKKLLAELYLSRGREHLTLKNNPAGIADLQQFEKLAPRNHPQRVLVDSLLKILGAKPVKPKRE